MAVTIIPPGNATPASLVSDHDLVHSIEGEQEITAFDLSALTDGLNRFVIGPKSRIKNSALAPYKMDVDYGTNPYVLVAGGGPHYFWPGGGNATITRLKMIARANLYVMGGGTLTYLEQRTGTVDINAAVIAVNLYLFGGKTTQPYNATANTSWLIGPGSDLQTERGISGTGIVYGGARVSAKRSDSSQSLPTGGTLKIYDSTVEWMMGNITNVELYGPNAVLDLSRAPKSMTITKLVMDSYAKRNPKNKLASQHAAVTLPVTGTYLGAADLTVLADESDDLTQ